MFTKFTNIHSWELARAIQETIPAGTFFYVEYPRLSIAGDILQTLFSLDKRFMCVHGRFTGCEVWYRLTDLESRRTA